MGPVFVISNLVYINLLGRIFEKPNNQFSVNLKLLLKQNINLTYFVCSVLG